MHDVLAGLQHSHERGVVHRDIKPGNIILTSDDLRSAEAKIADFGVARIENSSLTQAGTALGTPAYMSPEQLLGHSVDARSDLYAAGVLFYQLLTGDKPFDGSPSSIMHKALHTEPPDPSEIVVTLAPVFDEIVRKAMAKRPDDRFSNASAFASALRAAGNTCAGDPTIMLPRHVTMAPIEERDPAKSPAARKHHRLLLTLIACLIILCGAQAFMLVKSETAVANVTIPVQRMINASIDLKNTIFQTTEPVQPTAILETSLRAALSILSEQERNNQIGRFMKAPAGRALAMTSVSHKSWFVQAGTDAVAETMALEGCQIGNNEPCMLVARGSQVFPPDQSGFWPVRPMTRITYHGNFDPTQLPAVTPERRVQKDVVEYIDIIDPKAIALHPWGRVFIRKGTTHNEAESLALKDCNADPDRHGLNGPCFVYARGNNVVLSERRTIANGIDRVVAMAETISKSLAKVVREQYVSVKDNKAIAFLVADGSAFYFGEVASTESAKQYDLEACQYHFNAACVLLAVNDDLLLADLKTAKPQAMSRIAWSGQFKLEMLPWGLERYDDVKGYHDLPGAKAIAVRPRGNKHSVASGKGSVAEAEQYALQQCNAVDGDKWPCFIYASGNQVVLPDRRVVPLR
jgi:hypothetical protein